MCNNGRREIGGALLLALVATIAGWPAAVKAQREDETLRSGEKISTRTLQPPLALQNVATTLRTMGRADLADRLIRDYGTAKVRLGDPGSRATTSPPIIVPLVTNRRDNIMTLDKKQLTTQCDTKGTDRNAVTDGTLGWALTVVHEYVHMEQDNPTQTARFENAGWREAVHENQSWMRSVMSKVSEAERMPNSAAKVARLRELSRQLELLRVVHQATINDLKEEIAAGHVGAGQEWPTIEAGTSADLNGVVASANTLVAANIKNTRDTIARIERELAGTAAGARSKPAPSQKPQPAPPPKAELPALQTAGRWVLETKPIYTRPADAATVTGIVTTSTGFRGTVAMNDGPSELWATFTPPPSSLKPGEVLTIDLSTNYDIQIDISTYHGWGIHKKRALNNGARSATVSERLALPMPPYERRNNETVDITIDAQVRGGWWMAYWQYVYKWEPTAP